MQALDNRAKDWVYSVKEKILKLSILWEKELTSALQALISFLSQNEQCSAYVLYLKDGKNTCIFLTLKWWIHRSVHFLLKIPHHLSILFN